jgi:hypothetical protein
MADLEFHAEMAETADELVEEFGREVTLVRLAETSAPGQPWEPAGDPRTPAAETLATVGVMVEPDSNLRLGAQDLLHDHHRKGGKIFIVSHRQDISLFTELIDDDGTHWKVVRRDLLRPGPVRLISFLWTQNLGNVAMGPNHA